MMKNVSKELIYLKLKDILYILVILLFLFIVMTLYSNDALSRSDDIFYPMTQGWTSVSGESASLNDLPVGQDIDLYTNISHIDMNKNKLCLKSVDTFFQVYADGVQVYSYQPSLPKPLGVSYGMFVHTIDIPENTQVLRITAQPIFRSTHVILKNAVIEDSGKYMADLYKNNLLSFVRSNVTMIIGMIFLIMGISNSLFSKSAGIDFTSFGAMCAMLGFTGLNDTFILQILSQQPAIVRVVTYIFVIFLPYPALAFFASASGNRNSRLLPVMRILCFANFSLTVILTTLGITDYYNMVNISHAIIFLDFFATAFLVGKAIRAKKISRHLLRCLSIGLAMCILGAGVDMLRYHLGWDNGYSSYTRVGVLLFMLIVGVYLMNEQIRSLRKKQQEDMLFISEITESFAKVIDMKDRYTKGHSARVAKYTAMLSRELGYDEETTEKYFRIALLHDIGKIAVPSEVLNKPGKLSDDEYQIIKSHTVYGYEILENINIMPELAIGAGSHHERPDGKGYPKGLKNGEIPRVAQIIAVADTFDAMYSDRPYRKRMNFDKAVSIIRDAKGTQLTGDVVDAFLRLVDKGKFRAKDDIGGGTTDDIDNIRKSYSN